MPRQQPDHRARRVHEVLRSGQEFTTSDSDEMHFHQLITLGESASPDVDEAFEAWRSLSSRHVLNALILSKATDDEISAGLGFSVTSLSPYRRLFFDRSVFRNDIQVIDFVNDLGGVTEIEKSYYETAIQQGPEYLINKFRVGTKPSLDPRRVIQTVLNDAHDRFLQHRGAKLDSQSTKEALRWGQVAVSTAIASIDKGSDQKDNVLAELRAIFLVTKDLTKTPEQAGIDPNEVL